MEIIARLRHENQLRIGKAKSRCQTVAGRLKVTARSRAFRIGDDATQASGDPPGRMVAYGETGQTGVATIAPSWSSSVY
jgi:hypothetical protein